MSSVGSECLATGNLWNECLVTQVGVSHSCLYICVRQFSDAIADVMQRGACMITGKILLVYLLEEFNFREITTLIMMKVYGLIWYSKEMLGQICLFLDKPISQRFWEKINTL